jgi:hypothetical protein
MGPLTFAICIVIYFVIDWVIVLGTLRIFWYLDDEYGNGGIAFIGLLVAIFLLGLFTGYADIFMRTYHG